MVVDDNAALAETLGWLVEALGDHVLVCHGGESALASIHDFRPDVVLLDIGMPVVDGLQVCAALRADARLSGLAVIAQTGYGDIEMQRRTRDVGFDRHLVKPVEFATLKAVLDDIRSVLFPRPAA